MISRRDALIGTACVATAGAAFGFEPHRHVSLLGGRDFATLIPAAFGDWTSADTSDLVAPAEPGTLEARLYDATVGRLYLQASTGAQIEALFAHGDRQTEELQLHRPEICYPAYGFAISQDAPASVPLPSGLSLPARTFVAEAGGRRQTVLYWTRLGEFLPTTRSEQQLARMRTALVGEVADGVLVRLSMDDVATATAMTVMKDFAAALLKAATPAGRESLIGSRAATALASAS